jgi:hypothetical protein
MAYKGFDKRFKGRKGSVVLGIVALVVLSITMLPACSLSIQSENKQLPESQAPKVPLYPKVQGLYEGCSPSHGSLCLDRLKQMARAGFTLVVNYDQLNGNAEQQLAYANQAYSLGMKVIWGMSDPALWNGTYLPGYYSDLAVTCTCSDNNGFIRYVVSLVKHLPATWGYYVGDEVESNDHAKMKAFADLIKQLDSSHPRLYISGEDSSTRGANLKPFVDTAEFIGGDIYPIGTSQPITTVGSVSHSIQSIADRSGKQSVIVLQAFSWAQYKSATPAACSPHPGCVHFPTEDEMRQMRDLAVHNSNSQFILWYSYFDILRSDDAALHWKELVEVARTIPTTLTHPQYNNSGASTHSSDVEDADMDFNCC